MAGRRKQPAAATSGGGSISRVEAAAKMYGAGSPQHKAAVKRFGSGGGPKTQVVNPTPPKAASKKAPEKAAVSRVEAAARMYGTGSPQHKAAIAKFGSGGGPKSNVVKDASFEAKHPRKTNGEWRTKGGGTRRVAKKA